MHDHKCIYSFTDWCFQPKKCATVNGDHDLISIAENKPPTRERKHVEYIILIGKSSINE